MPEPKVVVAVGSCTTTGGVFRGMYNVEDGIDQYIPVDVYIPGCAASPQLIIDGVLKGLEILEQKNREIEKPFRLFGGIRKVGNLVSRLEMAKKVDDKEVENGKD
jgi:NADH:ubiquinone oxidoreductase subunit B-like Fe-S oxidoreductase